MGGYFVILYYIILYYIILCYIMINGVGLPQVERLASGGLLYYVILYYIILHYYLWGGPAATGAPGEGVDITHCCIVLYV